MDITIDWIATGLSIIGIILNAYKIIYCWPVWILSNFLWISYFMDKKEKASITLWVVFLISNIFGWYQWS